MMISSMVLMALASLLAGAAVDMPRGVLDICDGINTKPQLYTPYYAADCLYTFPCLKIMHSHFSDTFRMLFANIQ